MVSSPRNRRFKAMTPKACFGVRESIDWTPSPGSVGAGAVDELASRPHDANFSQCIAPCCSYSKLDLSWFDLS